MFNQTQAFKKYLSNRQCKINSGTSQEPKTSDLFNEKSFYRAFVSDMLNAEKEVIIYSPFASKFRTEFYKQTISKLRKRNIEVFVFTRPLDEYDSLMRPQIERMLELYEEMGVCIFFLGKYIHEKAAIIDRKILWEGSLNILSHRAGNELMRRTKDENSAMQVISYLNLNKKLEKGYKQRYEKLCGNLRNDSRQHFKQKIQIFSFGLLVPVIIWWTVFLTRAIISLFRF